MNTVNPIAATSREFSPETRLRPPRNRLERRAVGWWTVNALLFALPPVVVSGALTLFIPPARFVFGPATVVMAVLGLAYVLIMPAWRYRVHRWEVTEDAVYTLSGWLWQRWRVAPLSRVQTVDSLRGPVQQMFGLTGITLTTASAAGAIKIKGLDHRLAERLVEELTQVVQRHRGDAT
ncbi:PH domain-containing protein [Streptosporangium sp. NPDC023963]|uniref:PH domain-containing protein n=1 Tax=Streptosporangium sp. NPDC023963 TaxID=3155608 RepID=UPI0034384FBD